MTLSNHVYATPVQIYINDLDSWDVNGSQGKQFRVTYRDVAENRLFTRIYSMSVNQSNHELKFIGSESFTGNV